MELLLGLVTVISPLSIRHYVTLGTIESHLQGGSRLGI